MTKKQLLSSMIGIFAFALVVSACQPKAETAPAEDTMMEETTETSMTDPATSEMVDEGSQSMEAEGQTITETKTYQSPAGPEEVGFSLVVDENGMVQEISVENKAKAPISVQRQDAFAKEISEVVVGKNLAELQNIDRVGGSSLTTGAFNEFLTEAKARI